MKKTFFIPLLFFFVFFLFVQKAEAWTVTNIDNSINGASVYTSGINCGQGTAVNLMDFEGRGVLSTPICNDQGIWFNEPIPDGSFYITVYGNNSDIFNVINGALTDTPYQYPPLSPTSGTPSFTVYGYQDGNILFSTLQGINNNIDWNVYNITNQLVSPISGTGGNGELLVLSNSLPDGTYYVYARSPSYHFASPPTFFESRSNIFDIIDGQFSFHDLPTSPATLSPIIVSSDLIQINTQILASLNFNDQNILETHTAVVDWGDGQSIICPTDNYECKIPESFGAGNVNAYHTYRSPGVYEITITVTDSSGLSTTNDYQYISVYDPQPHTKFSGGRSYISPVNALSQNPSLTGKVQFGISAKYSGSNAVGDVSMNFKDANFKFESTSVTSLVTSNNKATLRGTGTVNGAGNYTFLVAGLDGGQGLDDFIRFQITDTTTNTVIYDSQPGDAGNATPTTLSNGQLQVN